MTISFPPAKSMPGVVGVVGEQLTPDDSRSGVIDDGSIAYEERVFQASTQWPRARLEDFEVTGRPGRRRWTDKGSGLTYREAKGAPLLDIGSDAVRLVVAFVVFQGRLVFLERQDVSAATLVHHGEVRGGVIRDGQIHWEKR